MWEESFFQLIHTLTDLFGNSIPTILACVAVVGQIKCKSFIIDPLFRENRFIKGWKNRFDFFDKFLAARSRENNTEREKCRWGERH